VEKSCPFCVFDNPSRVFHPAQWNHGCSMGGCRSPKSVIQADQYCGAHLMILVCPEFFLRPRWNTSSRGKLPASPQRSGPRLRFHDESIIRPPPKRNRVCPAPPPFVQLSQVKDPSHQQFPMDKSWMEWWLAKLFRPSFQIVTGVRYSDWRPRHITFRPPVEPVETTMGSKGKDAKLPWPTCPHPPVRRRY